jgi:DNA-binding MarR family transcriptional regulator
MNSEYEQASAMTAAALQRLHALDPRAGSWESELSGVTLAFVDAILHADVQALSAAGDPLRDELARLPLEGGHVKEIRGWLLALLAFCEWSVQRLPSPAELELAQDSRALQFLDHLAHASTSLSSAELRKRLDVDDSSLSRTGRKLLGRGLVVQRRLGRTASWELTPRARQLLREVKQSQTPAPHKPGRAPRAKRAARRSA